MTPSRSPVVLASGQLLTHETWTPIIERLGAAHDFLHADHTQDDTIAGMAARLLNAAPPRFDLVAHAMGGFTAFEVMRQAPGRVRRLVLMATLAPADGPAQTERRQGYIRLVESGNFPGVVEERVPILLRPEHRDEARLAIVRRMALETGAETFLRQQRAIMSRIDSRPSLPAIAIPTLLIRGDEDAIASQAHQDEMLALIPGARLETIAHSGHLATIEQSDATAQAIGAFLKS